MIGASVMEQVESYIGYKRGLGVRMRSEASALRQLARFAEDAGHEGPIDAGLATSWATSGPGHDRSYECKRYELARRVTDYRAAIGAGEPRLAPGLLGSVKARVTPYIYTDEEVSLLMRAANGLYSQDDPMRPPAMELLIGLMRATGVRPKEALSLDDACFDAGAGTLTVVSGKGAKGRLLPLDATVVDAVRAYRARRDAQRTGNACGRLIVVRGDRPLSLGSAEDSFCEIRSVLLGRGELWDRRPPRLYDLRHCFAVRTILRWHEEGRDVDGMLPALSTYMGHARLSDTYWYLTGATELMDVAARAFAEITGRCDPWESAQR